MSNDSQNPKKDEPFSDSPPPPPPSVNPNQPRSCAQRSTGHCVNYSRDNPMYQDLQPADKVNFSVFMMKYNVEKNKEFAGGLEEVRGKSWEQMSFEFIRNPTRLINFMTFVAFFMVIALFVLWLVMVFLSSFMDISQDKKSATFWMMVSLIGLILLTYILDYVYGRTLDKLENLSYIIK